MSPPGSFFDGRVELHHGDCMAVMATLPPASVDAVVTDPPYHLASIVKRFGTPGSAAPISDGATGVFKRSAAGFMGKTWDGGDIAFQPDTWAAVLRVLKPGGHVVAFGAPKLVHWMAVAIELAGFEVRDRFLELVATDAAVVRFMASLTEQQQDAFLRCVDDSGLGGEVAWIFGSGFPKSHNQHGAWEGYGTALKPAYEPIILARKPLVGTVAANLAEHGVGALNIDGCRVGTEEKITATRNIALGSSSGGVFGAADQPGVYMQHAGGRWPANVVHDGSDEVVAAFPEAPGAQATVTGREPSTSTRNVLGLYNERAAATPRGDTGSAARFFYSAKAKADADDRIGSKHPTVKPVDLMQWLVRLVCPKGGVVLDPFAGTGTTGEAAWREGMRAVLIEREAEYVADIHRRMALALEGPDGRKRGIAKVKGEATPDSLPLFGGGAA